jgi:transcriptional regulator with XRE-family HTH domain
MRLYPSQRKFAAAMKKATGKRFGQTHVSAIERGINTPSVEMLTAAAQLLDVDPNYLLGFDNPQTEQIQEMARLLSEMAAEDVDLVAHLVERLADHRAQQDREWRALWCDVAAIGGQDLIGRFERLLNIAAPPEIRDIAGQHKADKPAKIVNGAVALAQ